MTATARSVELRSIAQGIADALPMTVEEVVLTGSVSRGVADDVSDIEMLIVTQGELDLADCFSLAAACELTDLGTWGEQGVATKRVSGYRDGVPVELIWWSRAHAESAVDAIFAGELSATADALANGLALRTSGLLAQWQERLRHYPDGLAGAHIEGAALTWGGFAPAGLLTIIRPGERLALVERMVDDASRVVRIVFALNRVWQPTLKRLADRAAALAHKPERLAERIEEALTEPDPHRAALVMTELQAETVALAPDGPNINRARKWLNVAIEILAQERVRDFARSYTAAWCSRDPARVADHYVPGGTIAINGGEPTEVTEVARSFISAFPDIQVFMDDVVFKDKTVEYHWTFTGTNTGPGGTGNWVRISGFEEWTFGDDGLVVASQGHYDQDEYDRQLEHGAPER